MVQLVSECSQKSFHGKRRKSLKFMPRSLAFLHLLVVCCQESIRIKSMRSAQENWLQKDLRSRNWKIGNLLFKNFRNLSSLFYVDIMKTTTYILQSSFFFDHVLAGITPNSGRAVIYQTGSREERAGIPGTSNSREEEASMQSASSHSSYTPIPPREWFCSFCGTHEIDRPLCSQMFLRSVPNS